MRIYLDDDSASRWLVQVLAADGHDVIIPIQVGHLGRADPEHFIYAISNDRVLLTHNHDDFEMLHRLIGAARGNHPDLGSAP